jgi:short-subunit dehydrogenase
LERAGASLQPLKVKILTVRADLIHAPERQRLVSEVLREFGRIDVLINNAGIESEGRFLDLSWDRIEQTIAVNLSAPVHLTQLVLPQMLARSQGHVVHLASIAARVGVPYDAVYSGTKAALARWSEALRRELAGTGIHLSTVFPGYVTEVGMFARFGLRPPWLAGSCTPAEVAAGVLQAIERERTEVMVNSQPLRPALALIELFPSFGDWFMRRSGVLEFQRRKVNTQPRPDPANPGAAPDVPPR